MLGPVAVLVHNVRGTYAVSVQDGGMGHVVMPRVVIPTQLYDIPHCEEFSFSCVLKYSLQEHKENTACNSHYQLIMVAIFCELTCQNESCR